MKNNISTLAIMAVLSSGLYSNNLNAKNNNGSSTTPSTVKNIKQSVKNVFTKKYTQNDLLNILANIENDLRTNNIEAIRENSDEILKYLNYRRIQIHQNKSKYSSSSSTINYQGDKLLEIKYGSWFDPKEVVLPLELEKKPLNVGFLEKRIVLSGYVENEINSAKILYVGYDIDNREAGHDLYKLLSSIEDGNVSHIRKNIKNVYDDIFVDHSDKVSLVAKIRDNLIVAKYLVNHNQFKAAENSISIIDSLILRLIEATSNSPAQQQKIKQLRKELNNIEKLSDANYISEWEKIPEEVGNWWKDR